MQFPEKFEERMKALLGADYARFCAAWEDDLRRGVRANPLKMPPQRLCDLFGVPLTPAPFSPWGYTFAGDRRAGADPLHHAGAYYMQEPSAMSAVTALAPRPGERVLDLCAAPGGKSTQIAAMIGQDGFLWCNEYVRARAGILMQNIERCGVRCAAVSSLDTAVLCRALAGGFDAVLCDLPCSGEGMFRKEPAALSQWSEELVKECAARGREILHNAAEAVRPGGRLLFSTCTFAPEENEQNAAWFLQTHPDFEAGDLSHLPFGQPAFAADGFAPAAGRRIFPWHGGEGHFMALFHRKGDAPASFSPFAPAKPDAHQKDAAALWESLFTAPPRGHFVTVGDTVRLLPPGLPQEHPHLLTAGVAVATVCRDRLEPAHGIFAASSAEDLWQSVDFLPSDPALAAFLRGETVPCDPSLSGWTAVTVAGAGVGFGKAVRGVLKNHYPKGLRLIDKE